MNRYTSSINKLIQMILFYHIKALLANSILPNALISNKMELNKKKIDFVHHFVCLYIPINSSYCFFTNS